MLKTLLDVIIVENNSADIDATLDALRINPIINRVEVLKDGKIAIDYIFGHGEYCDFDICEGPTLILLGLCLPNMHGIEILRSVRSDKRRKAIPVIVITSSRSDHDRNKCHSLGVHGYFVKPIRHENFSRAVDRVGNHLAAQRKSPPF